MPLVLQCIWHCIAPALPYNELLRCIFTVDRLSAPASLARVLRLAEFPAAFELDCPSLDDHCELSEALLAKDVELLGRKSKSIILWSSSGAFLAPVLELNAVHTNE